MGIGGIIAGAIGGAGKAYGDVSRQEADAQTRREQMQEQMGLQKDLIKFQEDIKVQRDEAIRERRKNVMGGLKDVPADKQLTTAVGLGADDALLGVLDKNADNARQATESERRRLHEERMAKQGERSLSIQGAASARADRALKLQEDEAARGEKSRGFVAGYQVAKGKGLTDAMETYRENALAQGVDPAAPGKNDPLSSQVSAAKAVLSDMDASDADKSAARNVLRVANEAFLQQKNGTPGGAKQDVKVGGKVIGQATTPEEAQALVQQYLKASKK